MAEPPTAKAYEAKPAESKFKKAIALIITGFVLLFLIITIIIFYITKASTTFIIIFYLGFLTIIAIILIAFFFFTRKSKPAPTELQTKLSKNFGEYEQIAKDWMFEQEGAISGRDYIKGIRPVTTETAERHIFGWHFKDADTSKNFVMAFDVKEPTIRAYEKCDKRLTRTEFNEFLAEMARGHREVRTVKRVATDSFGQQTMQEISEPISLEYKKEETKPQGQL